MYARHGSRDYEAPLVGGGFGGYDDMTEIEELQDAIRKTHGCKSMHLASIPIEERMESGALVWAGIVEVFKVQHAEATHCYAWCHPEGKGKRFFAVLHVPPIDSPRKAVQAAIVAESRKK